MQQCRVIAVDLRDSSRPATGYDTRTGAQDIWRLMTNVLDEHCFHVVDRRRAAPAGPVTNARPLTASPLERSGNAMTMFCETAASRHTPVSVGDDEVITLNIVQGDWNLMSPEGAVLAIENRKSMVDRYVNFCKSRGHKPVDVTSSSA